MDVLTRSVLVLTLCSVSVSQAAHADDFHESLQAGVSCSSENYPVKFEILESPNQDDGFFKVSEGLCRALRADPDETSTLFRVADCLDSRNEEFSLFFGGWLNMLSARFKNAEGEEQELICR